MSEQKPSKPPKEEPIAPPKFRKKKPPNYSPNIVPLLDVLFLLLLFFVLAGKFRQDEGMIPGSLPPPEGNPVGTPQPPTFLEVHGDGEFSDKAIFNFLNETEAITDSDTLYRQLKLRFDSNPDPKAAAEDDIVIIKYYNARWQFIVDAYNQAARAGYRKISFQQG